MRFPKTRTSGSYASIARNPAIWVGLPSQRGPKATVDSSYLNELYRSRAERAGIIYVDVWDGFVDEAGKFSPQGPDYQGQIRRLRTSDGIHFTKYGARKLALYVEREIERLNTLKIPVALPAPIDQDVRTRKGKVGGATRPDVGGMDRQTLRDWVIRFNEQGPDGLINKASPGRAGQADK
jgi:hypothetical protein